MVGLLMIRNASFRVLLILFCLVLSSEMNGQGQKSIDSLISEMTISEKIGQMTQININVILKGEIFHNVEPFEIDEEKLRKAIDEYHVGSFLDSPGHAISTDHWKGLIDAIQIKTRGSRMGIPVIYAIDGIHGANYISGATLYPHPIAQAATWNPNLVRKLSRQTSLELLEAGINWNFAPVADMGRQPLWSSFPETYGEDVLLATQMNVAAVEGFQSSSVASCAKHYIAQSAPYTGKDRTPVYLDERQIRQYFLPPFEAAIEAGLQSIMIGSGELNGIPLHSNRHWINEVLRKELGFDGVVITDWGDIERLVTTHRTAANYNDAVVQALDAGIDVCMVPNDYKFCDALKVLVEEGRILESRLDESVRRVLELKRDLGLLEIEAKESSKLNREKDQELAMLVASESITLLKNKEEALPIRNNEKVLVTGPGAEFVKYLNGPWSRTWQGTDAEVESDGGMTISQAMESRGELVQFVSSGTVDSLSITDKLLSLAANADKIIVCLAEEPATEKPGDLESLDLNAEQKELIRVLSKFEGELVLVLNFGRPRIIEEETQLADAIVMAYWSGQEGGKAIADVLFGDVNPSGRLPYTYPRSTNSLLTYDRKHSEEVDVNYGQNGYDPQWPFGFGLSYSHVEYSGIGIDHDSLFGTDSLTVSVDLSNLSDRATSEVVQLYVSDDVASVTPSVKRLISFKKRILEAGEKHTMSFKISQRDLSYVGLRNERITEDGWFTLRIGDLNSRFYYSKN